MRTSAELRHFRCLLEPHRNFMLLAASVFDFHVNKVGDYRLFACWSSDAGVITFLMKKAKEEWPEVEGHTGCKEMKGP